MTKTICPKFFDYIINYENSLTTNQIGFDTIEINLVFVVVIVDVVFVFVFVVLDVDIVAIATLKVVVVVDVVFVDHNVDVVVNQQQRLI